MVKYTSNKAIPNEPTWLNNLGRNPFPSPLTASLCMRLMHDLCYMKRICMSDVWLKCHRPSFWKTKPNHSMILLIALVFVLHSPCDPSSMDRAAKLRRLEQRKRALPRMSETAFSALVADIRRNGLPELHSRRDQADARRLVTSPDTLHGPLITPLRLIGPSGQYSVDVINLLAFLDVAYKECAGFRRLIRTRHSMLPSSQDRPWNLIMYADEVTPSSAHCYVDRRKFWAFYVTFAEFGPLVLNVVMVMESYTKRIPSRSYSFRTRRRESCKWLLPLTMIGAERQQSVVYCSNHRLEGIVRQLRRWYIASVSAYAALILPWPYRPDAGGRVAGRRWHRRGHSYLF